MKKSIATLICVIMTAPTAFAAFLHVEDITPFTTAQPPHWIELHSLGEVQLTNDIKIEKGDVILGSLTNVKSPRRLKRDATFDFKLIKVYKQNGNEEYIKENNIANYMSALTIDKKKMVKNAALTVGNHFFSGVSASYHAIEGAVENRSDGVKGMAKGAVTDVYDNSLLGYTSRGKEIEIKKGDRFFLKLNSVSDTEKAKKKVEKEVPNYTFEAPAEETKVQE